MKNLVKTVQKNEQKMGDKVPETGINKGKTGVSQERRIFVLVNRKKDKNKAYGNGATVGDCFLYALFWSTYSAYY